jgi:hypothetical protein
MGTSTIFDIIVATIIAGAVLLMLIHLNQTVAYSTYSTTNDLMIQTNMTTIVQMIENDFRRIGYCANPDKIPDGSKAILTADAHSITFQTSVNADTNVDVVGYSIGDTSTCRNTPNPRDRMLYRTVNGKRQGFVLGLTKFDFLFYDALKIDTIALPIPYPTGIYNIQLSILLESPYAYDTLYSYSYWRQIRLASRNLSNR